MAVKDEQLWIGGMGKEWTTTDGVRFPFASLNSSCSSCRVFVLRPLDCEFGLRSSLVKTRNG
eukprot:m.272855 g.272855  ORF g.272855 m.272855 type:complete len:62 (+) comp54807_c0_seq11:910-1095(+)